MKLIPFLLILTACGSTIFDPQLVTIQHDSNLPERLGYCDHPPMDGHGVYYVREDGKCVAKVK